MNSGREKKQSCDNYYPLVEHTQTKLHQEKTQNQLYIQQTNHSNPINSISPKPLNPCPQSMQIFQPTPPIFYNPKPTPTRVFPIVINQSVAIIDAHMFPCQKCGYKEGVGNIEYEAGNVALAWGALLFLFTGIFCFLPCVNSKFKDAHVTCARCQYKKAIVKPKCCC